MDVSDLARHSPSDVVIERYPRPGSNYRMTDMQAALGLCQLEVLDEILDRRRELADRYTAAVAEMPALHAPTTRPTASARGSPTASVSTRRRPSSERS